jgi:hypothetical protein
VSYEEDTCHMRGIGPSVRVSRELDKCCAIRRIHVIGGGGYVSYEEEDTCHMRRRIPALSGLLSRHVSYEEDTCHRRRRIRVIPALSGLLSRR